jgi:uncharacterized protein YjiS (DUF1127 family)
MTTIELNETAFQASRAHRTGWLARLWAVWKRRRAERLTLIALSQMDERLLRDVGIEPMDVMDGLNGINRSALFNPTRRGGKD